MAGPLQPAPPATGRNSGKMKGLLLLLWSCCVYALSVTAQSDSLQVQINQQVWKPFTIAFNSNDDSTFRSVHSKDIIRVIADDQRLLNYDQYFKKIPDSIKSNWGNWKKNIELRFIQRIASGCCGYEIGYYRTTSINQSTGEKRVGYGKFHVLLRKENGVWKILMDEDAKEDAGEETFLNARPLEAQP